MADTKSAPNANLYIYSSNIRTGRFEDFQKWVTEHQERFSAAQPKSWRLIGLYMSAFGLGPQHVEVHWEIESYQSFDLARSTAQERGPFFQLLTEMHSFLDPATGSGRVLKGVGRGDTIVVGC